MLYRSTYIQNTAAFNTYHGYTDFNSQDELMQDYDHYLAANQINIINETDEFERYLSDPLVPRSCTEPFDVLAWWKENELKYPSVASMARDILAIPITSVASEAVSKFLLNIIVILPKLTYLFIYSGF